MTLQEIIKEKRKKLGLTYEEIGKRTGVTKSTVRKWEKGMIKHIKTDKVILLAKVLEVEPMLLLDSNDYSISESKKPLNIYTILDKIKFEEQIKRIAKINNIEDPYLLMQGVFKIVQEFHKEILDNESNTEGRK